MIKGYFHTTLTLFLFLSSFSSLNALVSINSHLWDGCVPGLALEKGQPTFQPDFDLKNSFVHPTQKGFESGNNDFSRRLSIKSVEGLSKDERMLLQDARQVKEQILKFLDLLSKQYQDEALVSDLKDISAKVNAIQSQVTEHTRPNIAAAIGDLHDVFKPIESMLESNDRIHESLTSMRLNPKFNSSVHTLQAILSLVAVADVIGAVRDIRSACNLQQFTLIRKAQNQINKAEGRIMFSSKDLERISRDVLASRPVARHDVARFGLSHCDAAFQLADVRHSLQTLRGGEEKGVPHFHALKAVALCAFGLGAKHLLPNPLGPVAIVTTFTAAALHTFLAFVQRHVKTSVEDVERRHNTAVAEHEQIQMQFEELDFTGTPSKPSRTEVEGRAEETQIKEKDSKNIEREQIVSSNSNETVASDSVILEKQRVLDRLRQLVREVKRMPVPSDSGVTPPPAKSENNSSALTPSACQIRSCASSHPSKESDQVNVTSRKQETSKDTKDSVAASTWRPNSIHAHDVPRPSGIRQPTATPPPPLRGTKLSRMSMTPGPSLRSSVTPGPATSVRLGSATPHPIGSTPQPPRESLSARPPTSRARAFTPTTTKSPAAASTNSPAAALGSGTETDVEIVCQELVEALNLRIDVSTDEGRRRELSKLLQELQEALRAVKQQARASVRTESLLQGSVDIGLANQIVAAQEDLVRRTKEALNSCVAACLCALEAEAQACGLSHASASEEPVDQDAIRRRIAVQAAARPRSTPSSVESRSSRPPCSSARAGSPPTGAGLAFASFVERQQAAAAAVARRRGDADAAVGTRKVVEVARARYGSSVSPESQTP